MVIRLPQRLWTFKDSGFSYCRLSWTFRDMSIEFFFDKVDWTIANEIIAKRLELRERDPLRISSTNVTGSSDSNV